MGRGGEGQAAPGRQPARRNAAAVLHRPGAGREADQRSRSAAISASTDRRAPDGRAALWRTDRGSGVAAHLLL